jgi:hypothetical protein
VRRWKLWTCDCGYYSTQRGKCRSHPFPCRAMGPDMGEPVEVVALSKVRDALLGEEAKAKAAEAVWTEIDGPLARASTDPEWKKLSGHQQDKERFAVAVLAVLDHLALTSTDSEGER